jgi:hypothetical protein
MVITSQAEYEAVIRRIQELSGAPGGTPEDVELAELADAADAWDRAQGGEAAGDTGTA